MTVALSAGLFVLVRDHARVGANFIDHHRSLLFRRLWEQREAILARYPLVRLPHPRRKVMHLAALILAWTHFPLMNGRCPGCKGLALGRQFGAFLNTGSVGGVCTRCAALVYRRTGGIGTLLHGMSESVAGTPYELGLVGFGWRVSGIPRAARKLLAELGVSELPARPYPRYRYDEPGFVIG